MDATKLADVRGRLESRRTEIERDLDQMAIEMKWIGQDQDDEGGVSNHLAEEGSNVMEVERLSTISEDLRDVLAQVNGALHRIDLGTYGICQRCGQQIGAERLDAFPYVTYCITCQAAIEREQALRSGH